MDEAREIVLKMMISEAMFKEFKAHPYAHLIQDVSCKPLSSVYPSPTSENEHLLDLQKFSQHSSNIMSRNCCVIQSCQVCVDQYNADSNKRLLNEMMEKPSYPKNPTLVRKLNKNICLNQLPKSLMKRTMISELKTLKPKKKLTSEELTLEVISGVILEEALLKSRVNSCSI